MANIADLIGKTFIAVDRSADEEALAFMLDERNGFVFHHLQSCCESVQIYDIVGDLSDLVGSPLLRAEERDCPDPGPKDEYDDSYTWTFYEFATIKGSVTVRWYGTSNGYYSESVDLVRIVDGETKDYE